jgi:PAS domain S-box-containing protein
MLPKGGTLSDAVFHQRHRGILALLWLHVPALFLFALFRGKDWRHGLFEAALVALPAFAAQRTRRRRESIIFASVGLMTASAVFVHLSGGVIEAHFHFFVMVGVIVLYQDWAPFLFAIAWVVLHHGIVGVLAPQDVYNHPSAWKHPWTWAAIHGGFILAMSAAGIATWKLNESLQREALDRAARLADAQKLARLGSWEWERDTGTMSASDELRRLLGLPRDWTPSYEGFLSVVHPGDRDTIEGILSTAIETGGRFAVDFRVVLPDGSIRWLSGRGDVQRDKQGKVLALLGTYQDITDARAAEEELTHTRDRALEASRAKSDFLATMSHEIRTPMNGVIGLTGLLLDSKLTEIQRRYAQGVKTSGEALLGIINDILDFSKIEAGKLELEMVDFDLSYAIEEVGSLVAESARAKGLELIAYCHADMPTALRGDVGRLRQILLNFASNAVKFTEAGEVVLRAGLAEEPTSQRVLVLFEVADTGVGFDPSSAEKLFEPFSQADASTTRRHGGTGLGLAICRRLAEAMGGTVGVDNRPGGGSAFWLQLPLSHALEPIAPQDRTAHFLEGRRMLVVDDNETNRMALASQLRAWEITADLAAGAGEALELLRKAAAESNPYDMALLDMDMPEMDGLTLAGILRADPDLAAVRLLLLSSVWVEAEAAAEAGFVGHLTKPVRLSNLYDALMLAISPAPAGTVGDFASYPLAAVGSRGTLLIVEDHPINQEVARGIVAKLGYGSDIAGNGLEALQALELRSYDAVLMDCHMPEMDGFQATAEIRRMEAGRSHIPIIAMTAGALVNDREKCIAAGMDDYLSKPVKDRELEGVLNRWIAGGQLAPDQGTVDGRNGHFDPGRSSADGVLDAAQFDGLSQLAGGDLGFLGNLVDQYLIQAAAEVAALRDAVARGDPPAVRQLAHSLKGASTTIGANGVASACGALEEAAARGEVNGKEGLHRLVDELGFATVALRARV